MKNSQNQKKILLLLICLLLIITSCPSDPEVIYVPIEPEVIEAPPVPDAPVLIMAPTTKEDYRENFILTYGYNKELLDYIDKWIPQKKDEEDSSPSSD